MMRAGWRTIAAYLQRGLAKSDTEVSALLYGNLHYRKGTYR